MRKYLEAGKFVSVHGIKGEIKLYPWCDSADFLNGLHKLYSDKNGKNSLDIERIRSQKNMSIVKIKGIDTVEQARTFIEKTVYFDRDDMVLDDGIYFIDDLKGLSVINIDNGEDVGTVNDIYSTGSQNIIEVKLKNGGQCLIPCVPAFVKETDIESGVIRIQPIEGLLEE